jgi:thymidylate synthase
MYQRSGDMFLGVPFNIASTDCLVYIISHLTNKLPGKIIINIGDAHIYKEHIPSVLTQLSRRDSIFPSPTMQIVNRGQSTIDDYVLEDVVLTNYILHDKICCKMVA